MSDGETKTSLIGVRTDSGEKFSAQPRTASPTRSDGNREDRSAQPLPARSPREGDGGANTQPRPAPTPTTSPKPSPRGT